jgi:hypothetical protein
MCTSQSAFFKWDSDRIDEYGGLNAEYGVFLLAFASGDEKTSRVPQLSTHLP